MMAGRVLRSARTRIANRTGTGPAVPGASRVAQANSSVRATLRTSVSPTGEDRSHRSVR